MSDSVNHPAHYNQGKVEVLEFIEDKTLGFHLGNVVKYVCRAGKKLPEGTVHIQKKLELEIQDLKKAEFYLRRRIELLTAEKETRVAVRPNDMAPRWIASSICTNQVEK